MGSDSIALPALKAIVDGRCGNLELVAVYTQPDKPRGRGKKITANAIKSWARENEIPVFQPSRVDRSVRLEIDAIGVEAILIMAYGHMLSQSLIDVPPRGIWNLHTSLLPKYRGASPIQSAIASGENETGVSLMRIVREMDAGPVLDVEKVSINNTDTFIEIENKLAQACVPLLERNLEKIFSGESNPKPQVDSESTYVRKLTKDDGTLDFNRPASELAKRINGLYPWPGTRFFDGESIIKLGLAGSEETTTAQAPGEVLGLMPEGLAVACGSGVLFLKRLQRPGGKMLDAESFLRGYELPEGTILDSNKMTQLVTKY